MIKGMAARNLLLSQCILLNGSTYTKVASLADILKVEFFSERTFYSIRDKCLSPVINEFWQQKQILCCLHLKIKICGFQGMGTVIHVALVTITNMAHTQ